MDVFRTCNGGFTTGAKKMVVWLASGRIQL